MKALISPNEIITNFDGTTGYRVAQAEEIEFAVAEPLYWIDCDANVEADIHYFDTTTNSILIKPVDASSNNAPTIAELQAQLQTIQSHINAIIASNQ